MEVQFFEKLLYNINVMTVELFAKMLEKCNSFEEFKVCVLATLQNFKMGKENRYE